MKKSVKFWGAYRTVFYHCQAALYVYIAVNHYVKSGHVLQLEKPLWDFHRVSTISGNTVNLLEFNCCS